MKPPEINNFILNGFDRCGSSAISRTIATHPDIEIIMQPFNSGSIRHNLYQVINDKNATQQDYDFFRKLEKGILDRSYIKSEWFEKHSSTLEFLEGKVHLIKTTQNHFTIAWVRNNFPLIENWGIWRDPFDILASLIRNDFHILWYAGAISELIETVLNNELLGAKFGKHTVHLNTPVREMAFIVAVRSWFYFYHIEPAKVICYADFVKDHNKALKPILDYFHLTFYDFGGASVTDLNIIGRNYHQASCYIASIPKEDWSICECLFDPLYELAEEQQFL